MNLQLFLLSVQCNDDCSLPNLWNFLRCIKEEQALQEVKMAQLNMGLQPLRLARKYEETNECVAIISQRAYQYLCSHHVSKYCKKHPALSLPYNL